LRRAGYVAVSSSRYGCNHARGERFCYSRLPVVQSTSRAAFDAMISSDRVRLWKGYARAALVGTVRSVAGDGLFRVLRRAGS
ncbi:MAG TPA: hypothetical protein VFH88_05635, partial [Candidatus Krumholzibacteria bacterium]|nr:hypothetical protein [Candidatus Krumholzibacteria bacterium]